MMLPFWWLPFLKQFLLFFSLKRFSFQFLLSEILYFSPYDVFADYSTNTTIRLRIFVDIYIRRDFSGSLRLSSRDFLDFLHDSIVILSRDAQFFLEFSDTFFVDLSFVCFYEVFNIVIHISKWTLF